MANTIKAVAWPSTVRAIATLANEASAIVMVQLQTFRRLLTAICRVGLRMTWEKR